LFKDAWWKYYDIMPVCEWKFITGDTASKTKEHNDFTVFQCWGVCQGNLYLLDLIRGKWEAPDLRVMFKSFWIKHYGTGTQTIGRLRFAAIEDKSSGTGLIQDMVNEIAPPIPIQAIQRNKDKVTRSMDMIPYIASGRVYLPTNADYLSDFLSEFRKFTPLMTHLHDDQIDPTLDAIDIALRPNAYEAGAW
jgi:predicted phage terminase large subunit-like protein